MVVRKQTLDICKDIQTVKNLLLHARKDDEKAFLLKALYNLSVNLAETVYFNLHSEDKDESYGTFG